MSPIDEAIEYLESLEPGEQFLYQEVADKFGCSRSALSRRWRGVSRDKSTSDGMRQSLSPHQELELVQYIVGLHKQGLSPTREMVQNFGSEILGDPVSISWVNRFLHRNYDQLLVRWGPSMDRVRHEADSTEKYDSYFDILHQKMEYYQIERRLTFNMDEKGFMIGVQAPSKRVFSKMVWVKDGARAPIQDGNREWITVIPTICADGTTLPTSVIMASKAYDIWDTWVEDIPPTDDQINVSSSPTGWTNKKLGLAWLKRFDQFTKEKARRSWRLLICDSHSSHISMEFLAYATKNRILVMVFPSHSTHTLQPLDVGVFGPLQSYYSSELVRLQQRSKGLLLVKKVDFYGIFKSAYASSFTESNIMSAFEATGIWPMDRTIVTKKFDYRTPPPQTDNMAPSHLSPADWKRTERLFKQIVKDNNKELVQKLEASIHRASTQNKLLQLENEGLLASLDTKNKRTTNGRRLPLSGAEKKPTDGVFYSPRKLEAVRDERAKKEAEQEAEDAKKASAKEVAAAEKLLSEKKKEENRIERERKRRVKEQEKAEKEAEKKRKKEENDGKKALQTSQNGKRKASRAPPKPKKRQKGSGGGGGGSRRSDGPITPASPKPTRVTSSGRNVNLPLKFR